MKEFIEKLIGRLEEEQGESEYQYRKFLEEKDCGRADAYEIAIEIVNQLAEECGKDTNVATNDGWIPCSEKLPEDGVAVLLQDFEGYYSLGVSETSRKIKGFRDGDWWASANNYLAWQPLPATYQPKGE